MKQTYATLATLGNPPHDRLTSSIHVAERIKVATDVISCSSFEDAINMVKSSKADVAMVAGAYPNLQQFIMDNDLTCVGSIVEGIPALVLAGSQVKIPNGVETLYSCSATEPLITDVKVHFNKIIKTQATSTAAEQAHNDQSSVAICNELGAQFYKLTIHQILNAGLKMPFIFFERSSGKLS